MNESEFQSNPENDVAVALREVESYLERKLGAREGVSDLTALEELQAQFRAERDQLFENRRKIDETLDSVTAEILFIDDLIALERHKRSTRNAANIAIDSPKINNDDNEEKPASNLPIRPKDQIMAQNASVFAVLPMELIFAIFSYLDFPAHSNSAQTCSLWHDLLQHNVIWRARVSQMNWQALPPRKIGQTWQDFFRDQCYYYTTLALEKPRLEGILKTAKAIRSRHGYNISEGVLIEENDSPISWKGSKKITIESFFLNRMMLSDRKKKKVEAHYWQQFKHGHILPLVGSYIKPNRITVITPRVISFQSFIKVNPAALANITWKQRIMMVRGLAESLAYLHRLGFVHNDIKPATVFVDRSNRCSSAPWLYLGAFDKLGVSQETEKKLCLQENVEEQEEREDTDASADGGIATLSRRLVLNLRGSGGGRMPQRAGSTFPMWMAPEKFGMEGPFGASADIFSLGIFLWFCLPGHESYPPQMHPEVTSIDDLVELRVKQEQRPQLPQASSHFFQPYITIMKNCWQQSPTQRPTANTVVHQLMSL